MPAARRRIGAMTSLTPTCECEQPWRYVSRIVYPFGSWPDGIEASFGSTRVRVRFVSNTWERTQESTHSTDVSQMAEGQCSDCQSVLLPDGRVIHERKRRTRRTP